MRPMTEASKAGFSVTAVVNGFGVCVISVVELTRTGVEAIVVEK